MTGPDPHAVLADPTRRALLATLRDAGEPMGVRALATALRLHPNSVREQLARLAEAGLVSVSRSAPQGRGRPSLRYAAVPEPEDAYRLLAGLLAAQVADRPDAREIWAAAGRGWGRTAARDLASRDPHAAAVPVQAVAHLLAGAGFAPEPVRPDAREVRLRSCPFLPLDPAMAPAVCGVHLGFISGALRELGSTRDAVSIEPFVRPDLCVARLGRMQGA